MTGAVIPEWSIPYPNPDPATTTVNQKEESIKVSLLKEHWTELFWTIQGKKETKLKLSLCYFIFAGSGSKTN